MSPPSDRAYATACGRLASALGISQASARRQVDLRALREGIRSGDKKLALAERMLAETEASGVDRGDLLSRQLVSLASEEYFMTED
jgi:hypothetical protein